MGSITTWCKRWDEDTFADEYKPVLNRKTHEKVKPSPTASATGVDKQKDPAGTYPTPWQHLAAFDLNHINGRWKKIEEMKNCVHCGGHKDGSKFMSRVCPGSFACQILKDHHCKPTKIGKPVPKTLLFREASRQLWLTLALPSLKMQTWIRLQSLQNWLTRVALRHPTPSCGWDGVSRQVILAPT